MSARPSSGAFNQQGTKPITGRRFLDSYLFIRKQEYFNNFKQLGAVG
jgi:hypothetical protein